MVTDDQAFKQVIMQLVMLKMQNTTSLVTNLV